MPARITAFVSLLIVFSSCQRSEVPQRPNNDPLLVKTVMITASSSSPSPYDTAIVTYDYNANNRLEKETFFPVYMTPSGLQRLPTGREYTRDGTNRITRIKSSNRLVADPMNLISNFLNVFYVDNTSTKVSYMIDDNNTEKTVFIYNASGTIAKTERFRHYPLPADPFKLVFYYQHQYDATGNLLSKTAFGDPDHDGVLEQNISYAFEYDSRINPIDRTDDALFDWRWSNFSPANCTKQTNNYGAAQPIDGFILQYQYRSDNKPEKATRTEFGGPLIGPGTTTYYYQ